MARKASRILTGLAKVDRALDDVRDTTNSHADGVLMNAALYTGIQLADGVTYRVKHGLGRTPQGWLLVDMTNPTATGRIERILPSTTVHDTTRELLLKATGFTATVTVSLIVF